MQIDKDLILQLIRSQGREDHVGEAERELPAQVDTDRDRGLLERFGLDVDDVIRLATSGKLGDLGGIGGKLGGLFGR